MPRISVTLDADVAAKLAYVKKVHTLDRSDSAIANKAIRHFLANFPDPPKDEPWLPFGTGAPNSK